ncbi:mucin-associated surface protein (MASP), partial [Trypanosoma cruzi]
MAMMMAGRVLLVCALCVLWCGAVFGHAMEDYCGEGGGNGLSNGGDDGVSLKADCGLLSTRMGLIRAVEAEEAGSGLSVPDSSGNSKDKALEGDTNGSEAVGSGDVGVAGQAAAPAAPTFGGSGTEEQVRELEVVGTSDGNVAGAKKDHEDVNEVDSKHQRAEQLSSSSSSGSSETEGVKQPVVKENSKSSETSDSPPQEEEKDPRSKPDSREGEAEEKETEEDKKNASNQAPTETPGGLTKHTEIQTATTEPNGQSSPEALEGVKQSEEVQGKKDSNHNSQTKSVDSIAANQQKEPSADHGESGPPSPTANGDAANNDFDKSTEDGIPSSDPAADVAEKRKEKQNENKDANPKETPVTAAAMKTTTATTGDSDGSTAVSHTTSPLLLL